MAYISKVVLPNSNEYDLRDKGAHWYGEVNTNADVASKQTTISGFTLENGAKIILTFVNSNSASSPVLSINNEATIPFRIINDNVSLWNDGETCEFIYDGSYWNLINYDKVEVIRL